MTSELEGAKGYSKDRQGEGRLHDCDCDKGEGGQKTHLQMSFKYGP